MIEWKKEIEEKMGNAKSYFGEVFIISNDSVKEYVERYGSWQTI